MSIPAGIIGLDCITLQGFHCYFIHVILFFGFSKSQIKLSQWSEFQKTGPLLENYFFILECIRLGDSGT